MRFSIASINLEEVQLFHRHEVLRQVKRRKWNGERDAVGDYAASLRVAGFTMRGAIMRIPGARM